MTLRAQSRSCFDYHFLLTHDDRPFGEFRRPWFGEAIQLKLMGHRRLTFRRASIFGHRFELIDQADDQIIGRAERSGFWRPKWDITIEDTEPVSMASSSLFSRSHAVEQNGQVVGNVRQLGFCSSGWVVETDEQLSMTQQMVVGLLSQILLDRRQRQQ